MKSKMEIRQFAVNTALAFEDVTSETLIPTAEKIEKYVLGSAELPENYDDFSQLNKMKDLLTQGIASTTPNMMTNGSVIEKTGEETSENIKAE